MVAGDTPQAGATVHHVGHSLDLRPPEGPRYPRFLRQEAVTGPDGHVRLAPFPGEQEFRAERDGLVSVPWQGAHPTRVVLELGRSFTAGGVVSFSNFGSEETALDGEPGF